MENYLKPTCLERDPKAEHSTQIWKTSYLYGSFFTYFDVMNVFTKYCIQVMGYPVYQIN